MAWVASDEAGYKSSSCEEGREMHLFQELMSIGCEKQMEKKNTRFNFLMLTFICRKLIPSAKRGRREYASSREGVPSETIYTRGYCRCDGASSEERSLWPAKDL